METERPKNLESPAVSKDDASAKCLLIALITLSIALASAASAAAQETPAFGPVRFTRTTGAPNTFTQTFPHCGTGQQCQIVVVNGNADGSNRISSASISLNGVPIAGPGDFNQQVAQIVKPVVLASSNQLTVTLASKPGSFLTITVECAASPVILSAGNPGDTVLNGILLTALPIVNSGTAAAQNVTATGVTLTGGTLISPSLPFNLGGIAAGGSTVLNADFTGTFPPLASETETVSGTYAVGAATYCFSVSTGFTIPPAAPGNTTLQTVTVPSHTVTGGGFPSQPLNFPDDANDTSRWTVPIGPTVAGIVSMGTATQPAPIGDPPSVDFLANNHMNLVSGGANGDASGTAEPSGSGPIPNSKATGAGVVLATTNWTIDYSTDGGSTFKQLDPTTIFPSGSTDPVGYCCDQIVQYVPSIDRFILLLQGGGGKGYRLAVASPGDVISSGGTAWTYWNLTASLFNGFTNENLDTSLDYPDLSVGDNYLYASWDAGVSCSSPCDWGHQVVRISLAQLAAGGTITIEYTNPGDGQNAWGSTLSQDTGNGVFWAGEPDNGHLRVFSMNEGQGFYSWRDVGISSFSTTGLSSITPDGQDWLSFLSGFPGTAVIGATRAGNNVWFAWSAGTDSNFSQPHVELVQLDASNNFNKLQQVQIWNNSYAFAYPALATNVCTQEVGLSLEYGGNKAYYENHVVGFWGDFLVYITTNSNVGSTRFGDHVSIRQAPYTSANPGNLFTAFGYGLVAPTAGQTGTQTDAHYVLFGRPASSCQTIQ